MLRACVCLPPLACLAMIAGCAQSDQISRDPEPYDGISASEKITLAGTEPFWSIRIDGEEATFSSPDQPDGTPFAVSRFAGNNGLGFSGELEGQSVQIALTPGECSDGMSDRVYPLTATIALGESTLYGCGYTDKQPFTGDPSP
ncbi:MAG: hypothetical protein AAF494_01935 [Pseudomonadota bacterium]